MKLTDSFTLGEFMRASHTRILTPVQERNAETFAQMLQPVRDDLVRRYGDGGRVLITSFVRIGGGSHGRGWAVDVQTTGGGNDRIRELADMIAARYLPGGELAQVIYEAPEPGQHRAHVHIALYLVPGATAGYLLDLAGNRTYSRAPIPALA